MHSLVDHFINSINIKKVFYYYRYNNSGQCYMEIIIKLLCKSLVLNIFLNAFQPSLSFIY